MSLSNKISLAKKEFKTFRRTEKRKYFYYYLAIATNKFKNYIFLDRNIVILFLLVFVFLLFKFNATERFTLYFPDSGTAKNVVDILLRTSTTLMGLVTALTILSFNSFNKYFGRFAFRAFFQNSNVKRLFTLYLLVVLAGMYVSYYLNLPEKNSDYQKTIFSIFILLASWFILDIFPTGIKVLSNAQSRNNIHELVKSINEKYFFGYWVNRNNPSVEFIEADPLKNLLEVGVSAIKGYDITTIDVLLNSLNKHFQYLLFVESYCNIRGTIRQRFEEFINTLFYLSLATKNEICATKIIRHKFSYELYVITNNHKFPARTDNPSAPVIYDGLLFIIKLKDQFNKAILANEDELCSEIIDNFRDYICLLIREYYLLHTLMDYSKHLIGTEERTNFAGIIDTIDMFSRGIKSSKKAVLLPSLNNLFYTIFVVIAESKINDDSKIYLTRVFGSCLIRVMSLIIEIDAYKIKMPASGFAFWMFFKQKIIPEECMSIYLKQLDILVSNDKLRFASIVELSATTSQFIDDFESDPTYFSVLLKRIILKFDYIRSIIKESDSNRKKDNYLRFLEQLTRLRDQMIVSSVSENLINETSSVIQKFDLYSSFENTLSSLGYIRDEEIV